MLNLNAKKLKRLAIVLAMVAAAMMMILTVGVFAESGDTAAAGDAARPKPGSPLLAETLQIIPPIFT